jgi:AraC family transcriptional regulator
MKRKTLTKESSLREYKARVNKIMDFINSNLSEKITLEQLAEVSHFSIFHMHRIFKSLVGEAPNEFIKRLRLERAASFLKYNPEYSIMEIAMRCGFNSPAAFARAFKQQFGICSTEFRQNYFKESKNSKTVDKSGKMKLSSSIYVEFIKSKNFEGLKMKYEITKMPPIRVAYLAHLEGYTDAIGGLFEKLCRWAGPRGYFNNETKVIGIGFDNPNVTPIEKCRYYACISVPESVQPEKEFGVLTLEGGNYVVADFVGKNEQINVAYESVVGKILPEIGYQPDDKPSFEIYLNNPNEDKDRLFKMKICVPVKPL